MYIHVVNEIELKFNEKTTPDSIDTLAIAQKKKKEIHT